MGDVAGDGAGGGWRSTAHAVGDAGDTVAILRALHTRGSRLVVPREARSTSVCVTARRASGWACGADSIVRCLSIGTRSTLPIVTCYCCAHRAPRKRLCIVAPTGLQEVRACTATTYPVSWCAPIWCPRCRQHAKAVHRDVPALALTTVPRATQNGCALSVGAVFRVPSRALRDARTGGRAITLAQDKPRVAGGARRLGSVGARGAGRVAGGADVATIVCARGTSG